jgi:hypothetical protein
MMYCCCVPEPTVATDQVFFCFHSVILACCNVHRCASFVGVVVVDGRGRGGWSWSQLLVVCKAMAAITTLSLLGSVLSRQDAHATT